MGKGAIGYVRERSSGARGRERFDRHTASRSRPRGVCLVLVPMDHTAYDLDVGCFWIRDLRGTRQQVRAIAKVGERDGFRWI